MNYKNISKSLHDKAIFCLWRYEEQAVARPNYHILLKQDFTHL